MISEMIKEAYIKYIEKGRVIHKLNNVENIKLKIVIFGSSVI